MHSIRRISDVNHRDTDAAVWLEQTPNSARIAMPPFMKRAGSHANFREGEHEMEDSGVGFRKIEGDYYWISAVKPRGAKLSRELLRLENGPFVVKVFGQAQRKIHEFDEDMLFDAYSMLLPSIGEPEASTQRRFAQACSEAANRSHATKLEGVLEMIKLEWYTPGAPYMCAQDVPVAMERDTIRMMNAVEQAYGSIQLSSSVTAMLRTVKALEGREARLRR